MSLELVPMELADANRFVQLHHRHHGPVIGHRFSLGAYELDGADLHGVAIVGRPISRTLAGGGWVLEVTRCATDGTANVCSFLYAAAWRATAALGYRRLITYTLASESGASLRAAGWTVVAEVRGDRSQTWARLERPRVNNPATPKLRWEVSV